MDTLIILNDYIRRHRYEHNIGVEEIGLAAFEIEKLRYMNKVYQTLYSALPVELITLIESNIMARNMNDVIVFNSTKRKIEDTLNDLRK